MYFEIRYRVPLPNGKWMHKSERIYDVKGKKAAHTVLDERLRSLPAEPQVSRHLNLKTFVDDYWRPNFERRQIKLSTRSGYESVLWRHVLPALGEVSIHEITPLHIEDLVNKLTKAGSVPKSIRNVLVVIQSIFSLAEDDGLVERSPVRKKHKPVARGSRKPVWTAEQVRNIVNSAPPIFRALFVLVALTGARIGEILALQWKHIDFQNRTIRIEQSLWNGRLVPPKTKDSVRIIQFGNLLAEALTGHVAASSHIGPDDFVFYKADGTPINADVLRRDVLYPILDRSSIPRPKRSAGFHAFRHAAASLINKETGNLKLAQSLLGHSDISTTADTHIFTEAEREASAVLEKVIFGESVRDFVRGHEQEQVSVGTESKAEVQNSNEKGRLGAAFEIAGGGFEPPTFGL